MLANITRLWTDLTLKCYNALYILILFNCGRGDVHRTQPMISTLLFFKQINQIKKNKKKSDISFHLTVAFRVTIWSFFVSMASYLGCWRSIYICDSLVIEIKRQKESDTEVKFQRFNKKTTYLYHSPKPVMPVLNDRVLYKKKKNTI